jgi:hypothetical protein
VQHLNLKALFGPQDNSELKKRSLVEGHCFFANGNYAYFCASLQRKAVLERDN